MVTAKTTIAVLFYFLVSVLRPGYADSRSNFEVEYEFHHVILMLDQGPLHARFGIALHNRPVSRRRAEFVKDLVARLDSNGNGKLTLEEANQSSLLRRHVSKGTKRFLQKTGLGSKQMITRSEVDVMVKRVAGQPVVFRQNNDASTSDAYIFGLIDEDQSGIIDADEMATAAERLFSRDQDNDECIGFDELQPPAEQTVDTNLVALGVAQNRIDMSHSVFSDLMRLEGDRFLPQRLIRKYDLNGNGKLSPKELDWQAERITSIDANHDGELSRTELAYIRNSPLDIDLTVDVAPFDGSQPEFHVHSSTGRRLNRASRPGMVSIMLPNATLTVSYRHVDPIPDALANARRKFNILDADANGYLDAPEIDGEPLFERGLFDQIDFDNDEKLFSEEVETFVRERAEVKAMSCRVNIYDTGNGFFQAMDHNNDGRVSTREMRSSADSLAALATDKQPGLRQREPARRYHIEFSRGAYLLFGPGQRFARETISFNTQVAVGPPWFVGSDRNNDGDLTWNEFLGHREDFHFLDLDQDGLIDPIEAERAEKLRTR